MSMCDYPTRTRHLFPPPRVAAGEEVIAVAGPGPRLWPWQKGPASLRPYMAAVHGSAVASGVGAAMTRVRAVVTPRIVRKGNVAATAARTARRGRSTTLQRPLASAELRSCPLEPLTTCPPPPPPPLPSHAARVGYRHLRVASVRARCVSVCVPLLARLAGSTDSRGSSHVQKN
jgi:hypothetical protein